MRRVMLSLLLCAASACALAGQQITGRMVSIADGDTFTLLTPDSRQVKIRMAEIDTPESQQPYGSRSKDALGSLLKGKTIAVEEQGSDYYGRAIGRVSVDGLDVNAEMVKIGAAWVYRKYSKDQRMIELESEAKAAKRGLWSLPESERIPPWEWRKLKKQGSKAGNYSFAQSTPVPEDLVSVTEFKMPDPIMPDPQQAMQTNTETRSVTTSSSSTVISTTHPIDYTATTVPSYTGAYVGRSRYSGSSSGVYTGPRGGKYHLNSRGNKVYESSSRSGSRRRR